MDIWTVYHNPSDFPDKWVLRKFTLEGPTSEHMVFDHSWEVATEMKERGLQRIPRFEEDDPAIYEVWL